MSADSAPNPRPPAAAPSPPASAPATASAAAPAHAPEIVAQLGRVISALPGDQLQDILAQIDADQLLRAIAARLPTGGSHQEAATSPADPADRRVVTRHKTMRTGKIIYNNRMCVVDCQLRDISETGCRVQVASTSGIPRYFTLHIVAGNTNREVEVAWRNAEFMGLKFID